MNKNMTGVVNMHDHDKTVQGYKQALIGGAMMPWGLDTPNLVKRGPDRHFA